MNILYRRICHAGAKCASRLRRALLALLKYDVSGFTDTFLNVDRPSQLDHAIVVIREKLNTS
jgi:hypothetical protein